MSANVLYDLPNDLIVSVMEMLQLSDLPRLETATVNKSSKSVLQRSFPTYRPRRFPHLDDLSCFDKGFYWLGFKGEMKITGILWPSIMSANVLYDLPNELIISVMDMLEFFDLSCLESATTVVSKLNADALRKSYAAYHVKIFSHVSDLNRF